MRPPATEIVPFVLEVAPADIAGIKFLFESYEEVGIVRTLDRHKAVVVVLVVADFVADAEAIVADAETRFGARRIAVPMEESEDWLLSDLSD